MKWIIGLVVVAVLGWFGYQYMNNNAALEAENPTTGVIDRSENASGAITEQAGDAAASATNAATEALAKAQESMPAGVDLSKISDGLQGAFSSAGDAVSGITDVESAQAALPDLEKASSTISGLGDTMARLPDAAKGPLAGIISGGMATLQPILEKATAIPGVGDIIEPVVTPMMQKLEGMAG
ncbi:hypothetical protein N9383_04085 [Granulosicoccus sp.]|nr:hypothetical protein [Granulosicoccus sp.]